MGCVCLERAARATLGAVKVARSVATLRVLGGDALTAIRRPICLACPHVTTHFSGMHFCGPAVFGDSEACGCLLNAKWPDPGETCRFWPPAMP